ncbi:MAG: ISNCY family transposase [Bacilli bacterium]|nr:ISNCY family transposase [Bacilli bacterium]
MNGLNDTYVESVIRKAKEGKLTTGQAAAKLGISKQYVNRLKRAYAEKGASAFGHGNRGKAPKWKTDSKTERRILSLYEGKYAGFNFRHFAEKLNEEEGIRATYRNVHRILTAAGFRSPKGHRAKKEKAEHPSRPRRKCFGELLQIDASIHNWFGEALPKATLHGAIDDATGTVMGLFFDKEETLKGYYEMMWQILNKYGIPEAFYGDNRTIFEFRKLSEKNQTIDRDVHINFKRMCQQLGIELITTSVSQAKGRIERLWGTLQSRLISELRLRSITTIGEANAYLPEFMADYNRRFAIKPEMESSVFAPAPSPREIDFYLSVEFQRVADNGSSFGFEGKRHQLIDEGGIVAKIPSKTIVDIYVTRSGKRVAVFDGRLWNLVDIEKRQAEPKPKPVGRPKYIPGPNHPWRRYVLKAKKG